MRNRVRLKTFLGLLAAGCLVGAVALAQTSSPGQAPPFSGPAPSANPWVGPAIIAALVSTIGTLLVGRLQFRHSKSAEHEKAFSQVAAPAVEAADDFVGRMFPAVLHGQAIPQPADLKAQWPDPTAITIADPPREFTTLFRLLRYLAAATYLERFGPAHAGNPRVDQADYYVNNKIRMALKGNLLRAPNRLQTEGQHVIGSQLLSLTKSGEVHEVDFFLLLQNLWSNDLLLSGASATAKFLTTERDYLMLQPQQLTIVLMLIYMIDLVQDIRRTSKWEEFRLFLVSLLRTYNNTQANHVFLYQPGDLDTATYWDTFLVMPVDRRQDFLKRRRIRRRQSRGRTVSDRGLTREWRGQVKELRYDATPGDLQRELRTMFGRAD